MYPIVSVTWGMWHVWRYAVSALMSLGLCNEGSRNDSFYEETVKKGK